MGLWLTMRVRCQANKERLPSQPAYVADTEQLLLFIVAHMILSF